MNPIFIIEHLEPKLWPWCIIEYESISKVVGKENLWFTNIPKKGANKLNKFGKVFTNSIKKIKIDLSRACVLEPRAEYTLNPQEKDKFDYYIFGGILGDEKLNGRTEKELTRFLSKAKKRNIGKEQFSTDNAVYVTKKIIDGQNLKDQKFQDTLNLKLNSIETVILPYRYPIVNKKPRISPKLIKYLKEKERF